MTRFRMVVTSDWHLDARTGGVERREEIRRAVMDGPVRAAVEGRADLFAFLGDLCDPGGRSAVHDAAFPIEVARRLQEVAVPSAWLTGNHDVVLCDELRTTLDPLAEARMHLVSVYRQATMDSSGPYGVRLLVLPYAAAERWRWRDEVGLSRDVAGSGPLVALGHCTSFPDVVGGSEEVEFARGSGQPWPDGIATRSVFAASGHFHEPQEIAVDGGRRKVHVPGSLVRLTFGDSERARGFMIVDLEL